MTPWEANTVQMLIGVAGSLSLVWMLTRFWLRRKELDAKGGGEGLRHAVDELREEIGELRTVQAAQLTEVHERIDFAERLLASKSPKQQVEESENTPA